MNLQENNALQPLKSMTLNSDNVKQAQGTHAISFAKNIELKKPISSWVLGVVNTLNFHPRIICM